MSFRDIEKERLQVQTPVEIAGLIRMKAARERKSISEIVTETMCLSFDRDPHAYGIKDATVTASAS